MLSLNATSAYKYDGAGRRVRKLSGENTRFIYGISGELVAEYNGSTGSLTKQYVAGGGMMAVIDPSLGTRYTTTDHLGSPRVVTNASGSVVSRHDYKAFGSEIGSTVSGRSTTLGYGATDGVRDQFTGYERDNESGLDYAQARYYASMQGRFTSVDPLAASASITNPQSFNRYSYALNSPYRFNDPTGMMAEGYAAPTGSGAVSMSGFDSFSLDSESIGDGEDDVSAGVASFVSGVAAGVAAGIAVNAARAQNSSSEATLEVRGQSGASLSPGNPLRFPGTDKQTLGPTKATSGWRYQIEEVGTVPDDASTWTVTRTIKDKISATLKDGSSISPKPSRDTEVSNYIHNPVGGHTVYSIDGPGINRARVPADILANAVTMRYVGNYTTHLRNGRQRLDSKWSVTVNVNMINGRVTGQFRPYHVRL